MKKVMLFVLVLVSVALVNMSYAITNDEIADTALQHVGDHGDTCKEFVQNVLGELGVVLGTGYRQCYLDIGDEIVSQDDVMRGDIIQLCLDSDSDRYYTGIHGAIVLENNGNGIFNVVDSNWTEQDTVGQHPWNPFAVANANNLQLHFYRLGDVVANYIKFSDEPTSIMFQKTRAG